MEAGSSRRTRLILSRNAHLGEFVVVTTQPVVGSWPQSFPVLSSKSVHEGLIVRSRTGEFEGRTTGSRRPCSNPDCEGWFIGVRWETGQLMYICSKGWEYNAETEQVHVTGGGEISARTISPAPWGVPPTPREEWPAREAFKNWKGWSTDPG